MRIISLSLFFFYVTQVLAAVASDFNERELKEKWASIQTKNPDVQMKNTVLESDNFILRKQIEMLQQEFVNAKGQSIGFDEKVLKVLMAVKEEMETVYLASQKLFENVENERINLEKQVQYLKTQVKMLQLQESQFFLKKGTDESENDKKNLKIFKAKYYQSQRRLEIVQKQMKNITISFDSEKKEIEQKYQQMLEREIDARHDVSKNIKKQKKQLRILKAAKFKAEVKLEKFEKNKKGYQKKLTAKKMKELERKTRKERLDMHYNLAVVYDQSRMYEDSEREYLKCLKIFPDDADVYYNLAILYDDKLNDNKKAVINYARYLKLRSIGEEVAKVKAWMLAAEEESRLGVGAR